MWRRHPVVVGRGWFVDAGVLVERHDQRFVERVGHELLVERAVHELLVERAPLDLLLEQRRL
jgi:hypothetical protein